MTEEAEWVPDGAAPVKDVYSTDELISRLFRVLKEAVAEAGDRRVVTSAINLTIEGVDVTLTMETSVRLRTVRLLRSGEIAA